MTDKETEDALDRGSKQLRLEAAASDMLAALERAERAMRYSYEVCSYPGSGDSEMDRALGDVRAAIAKAKS